MRASTKTKPRALYVDVEQGSDAWFEARRGIPTASNFKRIFTAGGRHSDSAPHYLREFWNRRACRPRMCRRCRGSCG